MPFQPNARRQLESSAIVRYMLNPHGNIRLTWDFCMVVFLCYTMFSEPVFMGAPGHTSPPMRDLTDYKLAKLSSCLYLQVLTLRRKDPSR